MQNSFFFLIAGESFSLDVADASVVPFDFLDVSFLQKPWGLVACGSETYSALSQVFLVIFNDILILKLDDISIS